MKISMKDLRVGLSCLALGIALGGPAFASSLRLDVRPGPSYEHLKWFGIFPVKLLPQMAVWIENEAGGYVDTVYVTKSSATGSWKGGPSVKRPEALPVWSHARGVRTVEGLYMPEKDSALPDAISGATRAAGFRLDYGKSLPAGRYRLLLELNSSYDYNPVWREGLAPSDPHYSGVNGQPSIVYACEFTVGSGQGETELVPIGQGSATGGDGGLKAGTEGLDSALGMLAGARLEILP